MAYPNTFDSFTDPGASDPRNSPSHSGLHGSINAAVEAIQAVVGTTAGTAIAMNFAAGDFAARINTSNVLQQAVSGTLNNSIQGTPRITGGTASGFILGTSTVQGGTVSGVALQGQITSTGTIGGGMIGTSLHQGGTLANASIGTATFLDGNITGASSVDVDLIADTANSKVSTFTGVRAGGTAGTLVTGGTNVFYETGMMHQFMSQALGTPFNAGGGAGTVIFPVAFSKIPVVFSSFYDVDQNHFGLIFNIRSISTSQVVFVNNTTVATTDVIFVHAYGPR